MLHFLSFDNIFILDVSSSGEGYFRLSAFGVRENVVEAVNRIKALKL